MGEVERLAVDAVERHIRDAPRVSQHEIAADRSHERVLDRPPARHDVEAKHTRRIGVEGERYHPPRAAVGIGHAHVVLQDGDNRGDSEQGADQKDALVVDHRDDRHRRDRRNEHREQGAAKAVADVRVHEKNQYERSEKAYVAPLLDVFQSLWKRFGHDRSLSGDARRYPNPSHSGY